MEGQCNICKRAGEVADGGHGALWEAASYIDMLSPLYKFDKVLCGLIRNSLGWTKPKAAGYICGDCREKVMIAVEKHYKDVTQELKKLITTTPED